MAATAKYKISGTFDGKPIEEAKRGFKGMEAPMAQVKAAAGAMVAGFAIEKVLSFASDCINEFAKIETAVKGLGFATAGLGPLAATNLRAFADEMANITGVDDLVFINLERMGAAAGKSEEEIKKLIQVSADYSAGTGKDMGAIFEALLKSYNGGVKALQVIVPEVKNLTDAELACGGAVDQVGKQFAGFSESLSDTMTVKLGRAQNAWGDFSESLGKVFSAGFSPVLTWLTDRLSEITKSIDDAVALAEAKSKMGAGGGGTIADRLLVFKDEVATAEKKVARLVEDYKPLFEAGYEMRQSGVIKGYTPAEAAVRGELDKWKAILKSAEEKLAAETKKAEAAAKKAEEEAKKKEKGTTGGDSIDVLVGPNFAPVLEEAAGNAFGEAFSESFAGVGPSIAEYYKSLAGLPANPAAGIAAALGNGGSQIGGGYGQGGVGGGAAQADPFAFLVGIRDRFMDMGASLDIVTKLLDPLGVILGALFDTIGPVINQVLAPLMGAFKILGATLGAILIPIVQALMPVIDMLSAAFVWLYNNAIVPIANIFIYLGKVVENVGVWFHNLFSGWWDQQSFVDLNNPAGYLQTIDTGALTASSGYTTGGGSGGSASYTAARDVIVNIYYDRSYINGDAQAIALDIYKTIKSAQALGVA
jgi:hypothetical protein